MYNASAYFICYSDRPPHFIHVIVCHHYLDCCGRHVTHHAFKLLVSMDGHHLETSVRVHVDDVIDFLYHCLLVMVFDILRYSKLYLPGDFVQEIHALHIEEINPYRYFLVYFCNMARYWSRVEARKGATLVLFLHLNF